ncbi:MAG: hypothetical protein WC048_05375 [Rhizobium sp.]
MSSQYQIIIKNMSGQSMSFYAFQKQASFTNSGVTPNIVSSCLASGPLAPNESSGAQLDFSFDVQNYVGAKSNITSSTLATFNASISLASAANAVSEASAVQPIELTTQTPDESVNNFSVLAVSPLGLSAAHYQSGLGAGSFGIQIPSYSPTPLPELYCGCAAINQDGSITLSSFITPLPSSQVYCAPVATYYVKVGSVPVGQVITYGTAQAALCDFTRGYRTINVQYNSDGSFTTKGS